jgi:uncharacterized membrane protein (Fun14 family)
LPNKKRKKYNKYENGKFENKELCMAVNGIQEQVTQTGQSVLSKSSSLFEKLHVSRSMFFDIGLSAGIGFLAGFLIRRFSSFLVAFVLFGVLLFVAQETGIIFIQFNFGQLFTMMGLDLPTPMTYEVAVSLLIDWIRSPAVVVITGMIGFLLGLQAG